VSWNVVDRRCGLVCTIANHMKKCLLNWNKDTVEDSIIYKHLTELSQGEINLEASGELLTDTDIFLQNKIVKTVPNNRNKKQRSNNSNNNNNNNNRSKKRY